MLFLTTKPLMLALSQTVYARSFKFAFMMIELYDGLDLDLDLGRYVAGAKLRLSSRRKGGAQRG